MNKIILIGTIFLTGLLYSQATPSSTENYIYSKVYLSDPTLANPKTSETIQYFDGLGRSKQVVSVKASPKGRDVVTHIEYDPFGRQVKDYLPVPQSQTLNGAIVPTPLDNATQADIYGLEKIYSEKILENSPLDRIQQQIQVGTSWSNKPVQFIYDRNSDGEVKRYVAVASWSNGTTTHTISQSGTFPYNQLYKNTVIDEDGNSTIEFKNGKGQVIMVRKVLNATNNADTYYVYNEYGQLAFVIPPAAAMVADVNSTLSNLCYLYRYDARGRLVLKKLPGKGWEYMVYDKQDRLIMTQDAIMGASKQWFFTKYDQFGRVAYTGIYTSAQVYGPPGRLEEQKLANAVGSNNVTRTTSVGITNSGIDVYYDNSTSNYPNNITKLLTVNYYDSYLTGDPFPTLVFDQTVLPSNIQQYGRSTKGLPVSNFVKNIEDDNWTKTYLYYDMKGRGIREFALNHLGGYTNVERQLDFSGTIKQTLTQHRRLSTDPEKTIREIFTYDNQNRLLTHTHQVDNNPIEILTQNKYNELSQLESKKVGGTNATSPLQQIDYKYNIRGWMTQINDSANLGSDLFGYKINYNVVEGLETPDAFDPELKVKPKYNGNIAEVSWKTLFEENEPLKRYGYTYDPLNRLTAGFYQKAGTESGREYFEKLEYDLNGNISRLKRSEGFPVGGTTAEMIDNLKYDYLGNRLTMVTEEQIGNSKGYPYVATPNAIGYDLNGNIINYKDKGLSSIQYNYLNLPKQITQNAEITKNTYRADGVKVKKLFKNLETNYLDGFQYKSTFLWESWNGIGSFPIDPNEIPILQLRIIPTTEGYYDALKEQYVYNFTDHLGNVRLSYTDTNKDGIIQPRSYLDPACNRSKGGGGIGCIDPWKRGEIIELNNYYPFGLMHNYTAASQSVYQYKYNGKELQETGMYDYGARMYMPDLGRWGVVDPLAEKAPNLSPFRYGLNNPIRFIDPNGAYETDGHFWTVYLIATMMGRKDAYSLAYYAEAPDNIMARNGEVMSSPSTWMDPTLQRSMHALNGGRSVDARNNGRNMLNSAASMEEIGTALHYFGDSYAHSKLYDGGQMYSNGMGHLIDWHEPDLIANRPELYLEYVNNVSEALGTKLGAGKIDMFTFNYVASNGGNTEQNSAIFETEIRIREGAKAFSVGGNQVDTINDYLRVRNGNSIKANASVINANVINTNVDIYKQNDNGKWNKTSEKRTFVTFKNNP